MSTSGNSPLEEGDTNELQETPPKETAEEKKPTEGKEKGKEIDVLVAGDDRKDDQATAGAAMVSSSRDPKNELFSGEEEEEEDEDCFKTPTSSDHKIPALTQCPPAPKKPWPAKVLKRKASPPSGLCRSLQFDDSSTEVESIFRPATSGDQKDNVEEPENKRPKKTDDDGGGDRRD